MAEYLVHLTTSHESLANILTSGVIEARTAFGIGGIVNSPAVRKRHRAVCFTGRKLSDLTKMATRYRRYGIVFRQEWLIQNYGAQPVWYLNEGTPQLEAMNKFIQNVQKNEPSVIAEHELWNVTPFIDTVSSTRDWTWEHEWRVTGNVRFEIEDISMLIFYDHSAGKFEPIEEFDIGSIYFDHDGNGGWSSTVSNEFDEQMEQLVAKFKESFVSLDDANLPLEKGYVEIVPFWDTDNAVTYIFDDKPAAIQWSLIQALEQESFQWCEVEDLMGISS